MSTNECVAVAVLYPWRWLSIALSGISIALWAWWLWCLKRRDVQPGPVLAKPEETR